jgi:hypothetical protein
MRTSTRSAFLAWLALRRHNLIEPPWYGPVCPVVWEGWSRKAPPYPDQLSFIRRVCGPRPGRRTDAEDRPANPDNPSRPVSARSPTASRASPASARPSGQPGRCGTCRVPSLLSPTDGPARALSGALVSGLNGHSGDTSALQKGRKPGQKWSELALCCAKMEPLNPKAVAAKNGY